MTKRITPVSTGVNAQGKANDCSVRALCNVTQLPYETSERLHAKNGRRIHKGVSIETLDKTYRQAGLELKGVYGDTHTAWYMRNVLKVTEAQDNKGCTLGKFLKEQNQGNYVCLVRGHALAAVDGQLVDKVPLLANKRVVAVYAVKDVAKAMLLEMDGES
jgi:hypothetical protein